MITLENLFSMAVEKDRHLHIDHYGTFISWYIFRNRIEQHGISDTLNDAIGDIMFHLVRM